MLVYSLLLLALANVLTAYKLLVVFPFPGKSHTLLGEGYVKTLLKAGHEVTYITPLPMKDPSPKLRQIDVSINFGVVKMDNLLDINTLMTDDADLVDLKFILELMCTISNNTIMADNVQQLMQDPRETFDAVIVEWMYNELYSGFATVFNCPLIWSSSMEPHSMVLSIIDEAPNPAYNAHHFSPYTPPLTFWQRIEELWALVKTNYHKWASDAIEAEAFRKAYGPAVSKRGRVLPSYDDVRYNGSLMLGNSHVSSGEPVRLPQNYIPISGYHIPMESQPLPKELQKIMDNAKDSVIYFSLGSMVKSHSMPSTLKKEMLDMLGALNQTVIWKFEEKIPNLPKNVHIVNWAPQQSILAHPNCVLFITHGGLLSTTETLHHGVPIIGIPLFADQFLNIRRAVQKGFGIRVDLNMDIAKNLKLAIEEMLKSSKYSDRMKELSFVYHNRPISPEQSMVFWIDHVIKTKGAPHLRSYALSTPLYQKLYLDLFALIIVMSYMISLVVSHYIKNNKEWKLKMKIS